MFRYTCHVKPAEVAREILLGLYLKFKSRIFPAHLAANNRNKSPESLVSHSGACLPLGRVSLKAASEFILRSTRLGLGI